MKISSPHIWPAEWERQSATWIAWPHNRNTWPERFDEVPGVFESFAVALAQVQRVEVLAAGCTIPPRLQKHSNVRVHDTATNDCWIRDYGPTFVRRRDDGLLVGVDWRYNAWGGKYPPYDADALATEMICTDLAMPRSISPLYCEGGALETDGRGTLLTTSSCLLSPTRNPGWSREMVEQELQRQLGVTKIIWLDGGGLKGDDTDGHIDQLARFVKPGVVVAATSSTPTDENARGLLQNCRLLQNQKDASDHPIEVHQLPTPPPRYVDGQRVPESYCNFVFANDILIVPTFRSPVHDQQAIEILSALVSDRTVIPIDAYSLVWGLGAFHCASQQQPESTSPSTPGVGIRLAEK